MYIQKKNLPRGFPAGPVVKNPPCNAGATASIPGPERFHMLWSNWAHVPQLLNTWVTTTEACAP